MLKEVLISCLFVSFSCFAEKENFHIELNTFNMGKGKLKCGIKKDRYSLNEADSSRQQMNCVKKYDAIVGGCAHELQLLSNKLLNSIEELKIDLLPPFDLKTFYYPQYELGEELYGFEMVLKFKDGNLSQTRGIVLFASESNELAPLLNIPMTKEEKCPSISLEVVKALLSRVTPEQLTILAGKKTIYDRIGPLKTWPEKSNDF